MSNLGDILNQPVCLPTTIPSDWSWIDLVDVSKPKQWKTISGAEMIPSGYPVFGANGFVGFYHEYNHEDESIAITCRGNTCGTINRIPPKTYITGNSMALDDVNERVVLKDFLYYALVYRQVTDSISGSAQPQITRDGLSKIQFPAPNIQEQQKIASILTAVDEVIESTTAQINKLKDLKAGMMQELLTKGIGHTEFKDSPVGRIPKAWEVVKTGQVTKSIVPGRNKPKRLDGDIPWITISDIDDVYISKSKNNFGVSKAVLAEASGKTVPKDSVVMTVVGEFGLSAVAACELVLNQQLHAFVCSTKISPMYLCLVLRFQKTQLEKLATQTTIAYMNKENTESLLIPLPSIDEQKKITEIVLSIENSIVKKNLRLNTLQSSKKALMQDLLTGKIRVISGNETVIHFDF